MTDYPPPPSGGYPPPPPPPEPPTDQPPKPRRRHWPWIVGGLVVAIVIGAIAAAAGDDDEPRLVESADPTTTAEPNDDSETTTTAETTTTTEQRTEFVVGDRVETARGNFVQVFSYEQPVAPPDEFTAPEAGHEFAVIDVEACAGPTDEAERGVNPFDFELVMPDNTRRQSDIPAREPALNYVELPNAGDCARGFVTFQVPAGQRPVYIEDVLTQPKVRWAVQ